MRPSDSRSLSAIATNTSILVNRKPPTPKEVSNIWDHYVEFLRKREFYTDPVLSKFLQQAQCEHEIALNRGYVACFKCDIRDIDLHEQRRIGKDRWFNESVERYRQRQSR